MVWCAPGHANFFFDGEIVVAWCVIRRVGDLRPCDMAAAMAIAGARRPESCFLIFLVARDHCWGGGDRRNCCLEFF